MIIDINKIKFKMVMLLKREELSENEWLFI